MVDKTEPSDDRVFKDGEPVDSIPAITGESTFEALSTRRRRSVIQVLMNRPEPVATLDDLTEELVEHERASSDATDESPRSDARLQLHHVVLPALDDAGVLEYDYRSRTVRYEGDTECEALLTVLTEMNDG